MRAMAADPSLSVTVVAPQFFHGSLRSLYLEPEPKGSSLNIVGIPVQWSGKIHLFRYDLSLLDWLLEQQEFDVVHVWEEPYIFSGYQLARYFRQKNIPFVAWTAQNIVKKYPPPFSFFEKKVWNWCSAWVACGNLVFSEMVKKGMPQSKGYEIPLAVDTDLFLPLSPSKKQDLQAQLGLKAPVIGFLGRLTEDKGCEILMGAIEKLPKDLPWSLYIMGTGPYEKTLKDWVARRGWASRLRLELLKHDEVPARLPAVDVLMVPSQTRKNWREQFGRMLVEAFASGVSVIGSNSGEIPFVIGNCGQVVPESDVEAWAAALERSLRQVETRNQFVECGLERAKVFSAEKVARQYRDLFIEVVR